MRAETPKVDVHDRSSVSWPERSGSPKICEFSHRHRPQIVRSLRGVRRDMGLPGIASGSYNWKPFLKDARNEHGVREFRPRLVFSNGVTR